MEKRIILGSQSPRRKELIKKITADYETRTPSFDEKLDTDDYSEEIIKSLSIQKAQSILDDSTAKKEALKNCLVVSADTVVILEDKILGKPKSPEHAVEMLKALSGKTHFVVTAVCVVDVDSGKSLTEAVKTFVTFQDLSDELIQKYVEECKPLDKAGAYGIQEMGEEFIKSVEGCLDNVIGLPTDTLRAMLKKICP